MHRSKAMLGKHTDDRHEILIQVQLECITLEFVNASFVKGKR